VLVEETMRRLDDAMKLGSPPHIRFIKIDDAGAAIASRLAHGHKLSQHRPRLAPLMRASMPQSHGW
jgi:hypothetical protein